MCDVKLAYDEIKIVNSIDPLFERFSVTFTDACKPAIIHGIIYFAALILVLI
jgi:hypothetical protein